MKIATSSTRLSVWNGSSQTASGRALTFLALTTTHNEAVNLSIAIYNMRQAEGIRYETLFRDETVGALDATNGKEYVRMLRRAMDLGGFHPVIFICHAPLVPEVADDILSVGGGCVVMGDRQAASI